LFLTFVKKVGKHADGYSQGSPRNYQKSDMYKYKHDYSKIADCAFHEHVRVLTQMKKHTIQDTEKQINDLNLEMRQTQF